MKVYSISLFRMGLRHDEDKDREDDELHLSSILGNIDEKKGKARQ